MVLFLSKASYSLAFSGSRYVFSPCSARLLDAQPCFRFPGVVMDTRQSSIWIKRWPAALGAGSACLGSYEPQKTFGNPTVSKSSGTACKTPPAVTVLWLTDASAWSSPMRAHGRGVSQYIPTASKRAGMSWVKGRLIRLSSCVAQSLTELAPPPEIVGVSYPKALSTSKVVWSRNR